MNKEKLLALAAVLERVAERERADLRLYAQGRWSFACGTPACALGHWAAANPDVWLSQLHGGVTEPCLIAADDHGDELVGLEAAMVDFDVDDHDAMQLFGASGCGAARTAAEASAYIREFVRVRDEQAAQANAVITRNMT